MKHLALGELLERTARDTFDRLLKKDEPLAGVPVRVAWIEVQCQLLTTPVREAGAVRKRYAGGDALVSLVVREARILEHFEQRPIEIELAAVGQPQDDVCEDRLTERRGLEDGFGVQWCFRAVVHRPECLCPDDAPVLDDGYGEPGHVADRDEARDVACQGRRVGPLRNERSCGWDRGSRSSLHRCGRTARGQGDKGDEQEMTGHQSSPERLASWPVDVFSRWRVFNRNDLSPKLRGSREAASGANDILRYVRAMTLQANSPFEQSVPHRVAILVLDTVVPFDLGVPCQVFGWGREDLDAIRYQAAICAVEPRRVRTSGGFFLDAPYGLEAVLSADTVVVPGIADLDVPIPQTVCEALRHAAGRGACAASICTEAFVLAEAGLLDDRRAATHWEDAPLLAARYPAVRVDADVLYVDEGQVLTSAGIAAGIDLCLYLVRRDYGAEVANTVARRLVVPPHRSGGQSQYAERPMPVTEGGGLEPTRKWMVEQLAEPLALDRMAAHARMSRRTFVRRFRAETGSSPLQWLIYQRVLFAQRLLERTSDSMERIAARCGFGSALVLRQQFRRVLGTTPSAYRLAFRGQEKLWQCS